MKLSRIGEFGLIARIQSGIPKGPGVWLGIGDDAAWVASPTSSCLLTADLLLEGVHFHRRWTSLFDLGHKSLAVNLSDIAAMGGVPAYVILSLGIPADFDTEKIDEFYRGIKTLARKFDVSIVGGDTSAAASFLVSVCLVGHAPHRPVARRGAREGDDIYVTGTLGDAALALQLLRSRSPALRKPAARFVLRRHHRPTPRCRVGYLLAMRKLAVAMIDVSDGLVQDLGHICRSSGVGAVIWQESLPLSRSYRMLADATVKRWALCGGEDYELLFCARPRFREQIQAVGRSEGLAITRIGTCVTAKDNITILDQEGRKVEVPQSGHDHFRNLRKGQKSRSRHRYR